MNLILSLLPLYYIGILFHIPEYIICKKKQCILERTRAIADKIPESAYIPLSILTALYSKSKDIRVALNGLASHVHVYQVKLIFACRA